MSSKATQEYSTDNLAKIQESIMWILEPVVISWYLDVVRNQ